MTATRMQPRVVPAGVTVRHADNGPTPAAAVVTPAEPVLTPTTGKAKEKEKARVRAKGRKAKRKEKERKREKVDEIPRHGNPTIGRRPIEAGVSGKTTSGPRTNGSKTRGQSISENRERGPTTREAKVKVKAKAKIKRERAARVLQRGKAKVRTRAKVADLLLRRRLRASDI